MSYNIEDEFEKSLRDVEYLKKNIRVLELALQTKCNSKREYQAALDQAKKQILEGGELNGTSQ